MSDKKQNRNFKFLFLSFDICFNCLRNLKKQTKYAIRVCYLFNKFGRKEKKTKNAK